MTTLMTVIGFCAWKVRRNMRLVRWGIVASIILLDIIMKAPVYYLLARIDLDRRQHWLASS